MPNLGPTELIIILLIVIAIFGAGKLANLGGALGKGVRDFRSAVKDSRAEEEDTESEKPEAVKKVEPSAEEKQES